MLSSIALPRSKMPLAKMASVEGLFNCASTTPTQTFLSRLPAHQAGLKAIAAGRLLFGRIGGSGGGRGIGGGIGAIGSAGLQFGEERGHQILGQSFPPQGLRIRPSLEAGLFRILIVQAFDEGIGLGEIRPDHARDAVLEILQLGSRQVQQGVLFEERPILVVLRPYHFFPSAQGFGHGLLHGADRFGRTGLERYGEEIRAPHAFFRFLKGHHGGRPLGEQNAEIGIDVQLTGQEKRAPKEEADHQ